MKGIADTGFLVAFASQNDQYHDWAVNLARQVTDPLLTCEPVLSQTAFYLRSSETVFEMLRQKLISLAFNCDEHLPQMEWLANQYADRRPDFADLCLIRMSELYPKHPVITVGREDFKVFRRNKREVIPMICPP